MKKKWIVKIYFMLKCSKSVCLMMIKKNIKKKVKKVLVEIKMYLFLQSQNNGIFGQRFGYRLRKSSLTY
jgi:hypothetical protein